MPKTIAIAGYSNKTGVGYLTARLARKLPADVWYVVEHGVHGFGTLHECREPEFATKPFWLIDKSLASNDRWCPDEITMCRTDSLVAVERCFPPSLFQYAKNSGTRTMLIVMAEWFHIGSPWVPYTDVFVAPTVQAYKFLCDLGLAKK